MVGLGRLELPPSRLSGVRSNQLSYRPESAYEAGPNGPLQKMLLQRSYDRCLKTRYVSLPCDLVRKLSVCRMVFKEVIQPQVLLQLPCYDFTPIINHTVVTCLPCGLAQLLLVQPTFVM
jgi:hypothetical protein